MKYLKLFENRVLDNIIDKIASDGEESLTKLEKDFLSKYSNGENYDKEEKEIIAMETGFAKDDDIDDSLENTYGLNIEWSEKDEHKYEDIWESLFDEDLHSFISGYNIPADLGGEAWDKLPLYIKKLFKHHIMDIGMF